MVLPYQGHPLCLLHVFICDADALDRHQQTHARFGMGLVFPAEDVAGPLVQLVDFICALFGVGGGCLEDEFVVVEVLPEGDDG